MNERVMCHSCDSIYYESELLWEQKIINERVKQLQVFCPNCKRWIKHLSQTKLNLLNNNNQYVTGGVGVSETGTFDFPRE